MNEHEIAVNGVRGLGNYVFQYEGDEFLIVVPFEEIRKVHVPFKEIKFSEMMDM